MRLVCPNCEAKYEVPEDAIPETGRDVQCANCGHAWYQMRARAAVAETAVAAPAVAAPVVKAPDPVVEPAPVAAPAAEVAAPEPEPEVTVEAAAPEAATPVEEPVVEPVVEAPPAPEPVPEAPAEAVFAAADPVPEAAPAAADPVVTAPATLDEDDEAQGDVSAAAAAAPAAYAVDESVLAILREEAEREAQARKAEAAKPLEVQGDLGVDAVPPPKKPVEVVGAATLAEDADEKAGRRARLPDVEEINSTLRPSEQEMQAAVDDQADPVVEGRSSFRSGFLLVLTVAIVGAAVYISADSIAQAVPALAGVLKSYVSLIDSLRLQLDGLMQSATVAINGSGG